MGLKKRHFCHCEERSDVAISNLSEEIASLSPRNALRRARNDKSSANAYKNSYSEFSILSRHHKELWQPSSILISKTVKQNNNIAGN